MTNASLDKHGKYLPLQYLQENFIYFILCFIERQKEIMLHSDFPKNTF